MGIKINDLVPKRIREICFYIGFGLNFIDQRFEKNIISLRASISETDL